jgi:DNA-binding XRE family transcriptional regulator
MAISLMATIFFGMYRMTIEEYRIEVGWTKAKLAREAEVDENTLNRAIRGEPIYRSTASRIAKALSRGLGRDIPYTSLDGLQFSD